jgi:hypothetical protein
MRRIAHWAGRKHLQRYLHEFRFDRRASHARTHLFRRRGVARPHRLLGPEQVKRKQSQRREDRRGRALDPVTSSRRDGTVGKPAF